MADYKNNFQEEQLERKVKLKFNLHSVFRSFKNIDEKIYQQFVGYEP